MSKCQVSYGKIQIYSYALPGIEMKKCIVMVYCFITIDLIGQWNSSVGNVSDLVMHHWAAHHYIGGSNPNACERSLASHAVYTLYSVHSYWWKGQVSHQLWPSGSQHASKKECRWEIHSGFETHEEGHTKSKTGAISGCTKWTFVQQKF